MLNNRAVRPARYILPEIVSGYQLDPAQGFFSAIYPLGADVTNMVLNPSFETGTSGYAVSSGAIAQDATRQRRGVYSLKFSPAGSNSFAVYTSGLSLVAGTTYYFSLDILGQANAAYFISFATTGNVGIGTAMRFRTNGFWQRIVVGYSETASNTRRVLISCDSTVVSPNQTPCYMDGWMVQTAHPNLNYIDGDQRGFVRNRADYYWTGTPHASTSVCIGQCRAGGEVVSLDRFGFRLLSILGLGLGGIVNQMTPLARGGAYYGGTVIADRQFSLVGQIDDASGYLQLARKRQGLIDLLKPDVVSPPQPMILRYLPADDCGNPAGQEQDIVCVYQDGMSGKTDNLNAERLALSFELYLPFVTQEVGNAGSAAAFQSSVTNANLIMQRNRNGVWSAMGTGAAGTATQAILRMPNGDIIAGGVFTSVGGVANTAGIARWDAVTLTWNAMGTGPAGGGVYALAVDASGLLYAGGDFTSMGGVANTRGIARWNPATGTWSALGTGLNFNGAFGNFVYALAADALGNMWAGGDFATLGGVANTLNIAYWDVTGLAWHPLGVGANQLVYTLANGPDKNMYAGGSFTSIAGVAASRLAFFDPSDAVPVPVELGIANGAVHVLTFAPNGSLFAGGEFTSMSSVTTLYIAQLIGGYGPPKGWVALDNNSLASGGFSPVFALTWDYFTGTLLVGGSFAAPLFNGDSLYRWNGTSYGVVDVNPPGTAQVNAIASFLDGTAYIGYTTTGTATVAGQTTILNAGSAAAGAKLTMTGPGIVYALRNYTTGKVIYFNQTLVAGETVVLDMTDPSGITYVSSFFGNILNKIFAGSNLSDFLLQPGNNIISLYIGGTTTAATGATLQWRNTSHSLDAAVPGRLLP